MPNPSVIYFPAASIVVMLVFTRGTTSGRIRLCRNCRSACSMMGMSIVSINSKSSSGYQVDGRVSIALDALNEKQKKDVRAAISDREHFVAITSDPRKVARLSATKPLFSLRLPSDLRIIYSQTGNDIIVMDLMKQSTLDWYGAKPKGRRVRRSRRSLRLKKN